VASFLRVGIREERWFPDDSPWLQPGEVPADALRDLQTNGNALSVFEITDGVEPQYIVAAWWAVGPNNDKPGDVGFIVFDADTVRQRFRVVKTDGLTADRAIDRLHVDIAELTAVRLAELAGVVAAGTSDVLLGSDLTAILKRSLEQRRFERERMNRKLLARLTEAKAGQ
jgi:hypothetical protein